MYLEPFLNKSLKFEKISRTLKEKIWINPIGQPNLSLKVNALTFSLTILTNLCKIEKKNWSKNTENVNKNNGIPSTVYKILYL